MSQLFSLLIPRWLERAWQETRIDAQDSVAAVPLPLEEQQTMPLPLPGSSNTRN